MSSQIPQNDSTEAEAVVSRLVNFYLRACCSCPSLGFHFSGNSEAPEGRGQFCELAKKCEGAKCLIKMQN